MVVGPDMVHNSVDEVMLDPSAGRGPKAILVVASIASFMVALDLLVVTTALDAIRRDLGVDATVLQWTVTAYALCFASLLLVGAALGDRYGGRRMLLVGLLLFVAGSTAAALSSGVWPLVAARVVQGAGAAVVVPVSLAVVASVFPAERRGAAIGTLEGITGLAVIAGPLVGGVVVEYLAWEWIFWSNVPIGLAAIPLVAWVMPESRGTITQIDIAGAVLVAGGTFGLVWGLSHGNGAGWWGWQTMSSLVGGLSLWAAFLVRQRSSRSPMLPLGLFSSRSFRSAAVAATALSGALYGSVFFMAQVLQVTLGHGPLGSGLRLVPWTATLLVVAPVAGRLGDRCGARPVLVAAMTCTAVGFAWLAVILDPGVTYATILPPLLLAGVGVSAALPVSQMAALGALRDDLVGVAAGATNLLQELGGALGVAVTVAAFLSVGSYASIADATGGFAVALGACAVLAGVGLLGAGTLPRQRDDFSARTRSTAA